MQAPPTTRTSEGNAVTPPHEKIINRRELVSEARNHILTLKDKGVHRSTLAYLAKVPERAVDNLYMGNSNCVQTSLIDRLLGVPQERVIAFSRVNEGPKVCAREVSAHIKYLTGARHYSHTRMSKDAGVDEAFIRMVSATQCPEHIPAEVSERLLKIGHRRDEELSVGAVRRLQALATHEWSINSIYLVTKKELPALSDNLHEYLDGTRDECPAGFNKAIKVAYDKIMYEGVLEVNFLGSNARLLHGISWWVPTHENQWDGDFDSPDEGAPFDPSWMVDHVSLERSLRRKQLWSKLNFFERVVAIEQRIDEGVERCDIVASFDSHGSSNIKEYYDYVSRMRGLECPVPQPRKYRTRKTREQLTPVG